MSIARQGVRWPPRRDGRLEGVAREKGAANGLAALSTREEANRRAADLVVGKHFEDDLKTSAKFF